MNIWRKEYEEGVEIPMPHRPLLDQNRKPILDEDGYMQYATCRVRSLSAGYLLRSGKLPAGLMDVMREVLKSLGIVQREADDTGDALSQLEMLDKYAEFVEFLVREMLVFPRIVDTPKKDDEISFGMLSSDDQLFFVALLDRPLADLRTFRQKSDTGVERVPDAQVHEQTAERGD